MDLAGSGTGSLDYEINDEPAVDNRDCVVDGFESDDSGVLQLTFSFADATHGHVAVAVSLEGFSPATTSYDDPMYLVIVVTMEEGSSWSSDLGATVGLSVTSTPANGGTEYRGTVDAENLKSVGGTQDALAIKFSSFDVTVEPQGE